MTRPFLFDILINVVISFISRSHVCNFTDNSTSNRQRIHVGMGEMYEMDRTYQKFYTQLAKEKCLCWGKYVNLLMLL